MRGTLLLASAGCLAPASPPKPHIFMVIVDDWGWNDAGFHQQVPDKSIQTPNVDGLVKKGIKLDRHYVFNYCSPTRSSFQSGRLPIHVWTSNDDPITVNRADPVHGYAGIPPNMTGIATRLREAGYRTHMTGKWDCGFAHWAQSPVGRGYETYFGYLHHANDYWTETLSLGSVGQYNCPAGLVDLWDTTHAASRRNGTAYEEDLFTNNTLDILERHDALQPLFMVHAFHIVHTPLQVPQDYEDKFSFVQDTNHRKYCAMVSHMDDSMGKFEAKLQSKSMWADTLLVLTSDNGGPIYAGGTYQVTGAASNRPLHGGKISDWEGGIRVNAFVSGGFIPQALRGTVHAGYVHVADWYATFCGLAGLDPTDKQAAVFDLPPIDSIDQWPSITGAAAGPRTEIHISEATLINGTYKLLTGDCTGGKLTKTGCVPLVPMDGYWDGYGMTAIINTATKFKNCKQGCIYDILSDPNEEAELSATQAGVKARMIARLAELNKFVYRPDRGQPDQAGCEQAARNGGFYGPFIGDPIGPTARA